jgi:hypothetical protein
VRSYVHRHCAVVSAIQHVFIDLINLLALNTSTRVTICSHLISSCCLC